MNVELGDWLVDSVSRAQDKRDNDIEMKVKHEQERSTHQNLVAFLMEHKIDPRSPLVYIVKQTKALPADLVTQQLHREWNDYLTVLHAYNTQTIKDNERAQAHFFDTFVSHLRFQTLFENNPLWKHVPSSIYVEQRFEMLSTTPPLVDTHKRKFVSDDERTPRQMNLDKTELLDYANKLNEKASTEVQVTESKWWIRQSLQPFTDKALAAFQTANQFIAKTATDTNPIQWRSPVDALLERVNETKATWREEFTNADEKEAEGAFNLVGQQAHKIFQDNSSLFQKRETMAYLTQYGVFLAHRSIHETLQSAHSAVNAALEGTRDLLKSPVERMATQSTTPAFYANKRVRLTRSDEGEDLTGLEHHLRQLDESLTESINKQNKQVPLVTSISKDREVAAESAISLDYANWVKAVLKVADGQVLQLIKALDSVLPSTIHCTMLLNHESDRVKSVASDMQKQRESGIAHMTICEARVKATRTHYETLARKLELRQGLAQHEFYQLPTTTREDWLSLPVSDSVVSSLVSLFTDSKVPFTASPQGQNAVELMTSFVKHETILKSDTFRDLMTRVSELLVGYYTANLFEST